MAQRLPKNENIDTKNYFFIHHNLLQKHELVGSKQLVLANKMHLRNLDLMLRNPSYIFFEKLQI